MTQRVQLSRSSRFHRVPPPLEEVVVFKDNLEGLRLDSLGGWSHYDASARPAGWNIDTLFACQGHAWWCGRRDSLWIYDSNRAGYDNNWAQFLENRSPLDSVQGNAAVRISFRHRFSAEPNYDYGYVDVLDRAAGWTQLAQFTGEVKGAGTGLCDTFTVVIPDPIVQEWRAGSPEDSIFTPLPIPFRFRFTSDIAYSSSDGLYDGDGWIIDNVTVRGGTKVLFSDDMEHGPGNWVVSTFPAVGDYFTLQNNVLTEDICSTNRSRLWVDWNPVFQSMVSRVDNWLVTPSVATSRSSEVAIILDVYRNLPLNACFYYHFNFRTKNIGDGAWSGWTDPSRLLYYGSQKDWARQKISLTGAGNHDSLQVEIGIKDYSDIYCDGVSSPANVYAHFDNIEVTIVGTAPPSFVSRDLDLFNDTFMTTPFFNDDNFNTPLGDSAVIQVNAPRGLKNASMFYRFNGGSFAAQPLQQVAPALPTYFHADVPAGSYPANTKLEYYFSVTDSLDATAYYPLDAPTDHLFLSAAILPLKTAVNLPMGCVDSLSSILFVNRFVGREPEPYVASALSGLGFKYDTWNVNGPTSGVGNCLGGSDPAQTLYHWPVTDVDKLLQYSTIIWHTGNLKAFTMSQQDQAVLQSWIQQPGSDRNLWITGDNLAYELATQGQDYNNFLAFTCGTRYLRDVWENFPQDSLRPVVKGVNGSPSAGRFMHVNGDCPLIDDFDMVALSSNAGTGKAGVFLTYPTTWAASTRFATKYSSFSSDSARVIFTGFSFNDIEESGERLQLLYGIVKTYFKQTACYVATAVEEDPTAEAPAYGNSLAQNFPNPFNPETAIRYSVAQAGLVEIRIFTVTGALARTLVSRVHGPGDYIARWNGSDDQGRPLPSGAYFYRIETPGFQDSKKLILLR